MVKGSPVCRLLLVLLLFAACSGDMEKQAVRKTLEPSTMFADGRSARDQPRGTIAWEDSYDPAFRTGAREGELLTSFPVPITLDLLEQGRERFDVFCSPCHGLSGYGDGMVVQRGFIAPPSFHSERLRHAPPGHFVNVIAEGFGAMYDYSDRVSPEERWAIAAYIRALQLSQHATLADVPAGELDE